MTIKDEDIKLFSLKGVSIIIGIIGVVLSGSVIVIRMQDQIIATQSMHTYQLSMESGQLTRITQRLSAIKHQITNKH